MPTPRCDCHRCVHYFITWDEKFPNGCRRMGFKSRRYPADEVRQAMNGQECRLFEPKAPLKASKDPFPD